jgi:hypothetical protein
MESMNLWVSAELFKQLKHSWIVAILPQPDAALLVASLKQSRKRHPRVGGAARCNHENVVLDLGHILTIIQ